MIHNYLGRPKYVEHLPYEIEVYQKALLLCGV